MSAGRSSSCRAALIVAMVAFLVAVTSGAWAQTASAPATPAQPPAAGEQKPVPKAVGNNLGLAGKLGQEIAKAPEGKGKGQIDPAAPRGVFGIPGAPDISFVLAFVWACWVGWIFSSVGAFGGVMAGVGHMSVYGLGDYVRTFRDSAPGLNRTLTDSIRTSNQFLVGLSSILSVINYLKAKRMSWPLGLALGVGSIVGAFLAASLTGGKTSFSDYQGWFGVFVLAVGIVLFYETTPKGQASKKKAKEAAQTFGEHLVTFRATEPPRFLEIRLRKSAVVAFQFQAAGRLFELLRGSQPENQVQIRQAVTCKVIDTLGLGALLAQIQLLHLVTHDLGQMHGGWLLFANSAEHFVKLPKR